MTFPSRSVVAAFVLLTASACSGGGDDDSDETGGSSGSGGTSTTTGGTGGGTTGGTGGGTTGGTGGTSAGTGGGASGSAGTGAGPTCGGMPVSTVMANAANNYAFSSTITLPPVTVQPDTELTFDWSAVTHDFMNHELSGTADIDTANLILWSLTEAELQQKLNDDALSQRESVVPAMVPTENMVTSVSLFDFLSAAGQPLTQEEILPYVNATNYPPADYTYTVIIATGDLIAGGQARMIQSFKLDPNSTNTQVNLTNTSTHLEFTVDLEALQPTRIPAGQNAITIDWDDMTVNAMGHEFLPTQITEMRVAQYTQTPAQLEAEFLDLELIAQKTFEAPVTAGTSLALSELKTSTGETFTGIDGNGTWILALVCGACRNPAPWYLTILTPCQ